MSEQAEEVVRPEENEDRAGSSKAMAPLSRQEIEFARAEFKVKMTALVLDARKRAKQRGITDDMVAGRLGMSVKKLRESYLNPLPGNGWHPIPDLCLALEIDLEVTVRRIGSAIYGPDGNITGWIPPDVV